MYSDDQPWAPAADGQRIVVVGCGGHARVLIAIARRDLAATLVGYLDRSDHGERFGLPYLGDDEAAASHGDCRLLLGVGLMTGARARWDLFRFHRDKGGRFLTLISSRASIDEEVSPGAGTVVMDMAVVSPGATLGEACIVNTGAIVEHDCRLGDNVHVSPGAVLAGEVTVGDHVLVGAGAVILPQVSVSAGCIIGAGAVVTTDIAAPGMWAGVPAARRGEGMAL